MQRERWKEMCFVGLPQEKFLSISFTFCSLHSRKKKLIRNTIRYFGDRGDIRLNVVAETQVGACTAYRMIQPDDDPNQ